MRRGGELAELMGHTSIDTTRIYVHTSREQLQAAVERNERRRGNPLLEREAKRHT